MGIPTLLNCDVLWISPHAYLHSATITELARAVDISHYCTVTIAYTSHAVDTMMSRGAISDQQQEEYAIYREAAVGMDATLMEKKGSDRVVKMLHRNKNAHVGQFLSGAAKRSLAEQRKADEAVQQQYYGYQFQ